MDSILDLIWNDENIDEKVVSASMSISCIIVNCGNPPITPPPLLNAAPKCPSHES